MRDVLCLIHQFPPVFSGGVLRPFRFACALPEHGWLPRVITAEPDPISPRDDSLLAELPAAIEVTRARCPPRDLLGAVLIRAGLPGLGWAVLRRRQGWDRAGPWAPHLAAAVDAAVARRRPDVLWATLSPWSLLGPATALARRHALPLVLDFRDEWTLSAYYAMPPRRLAAARRMEHEALLVARRVTMFSPYSPARYRVLYPDLDDHLFVPLPNGYDERDFADLAPEPLAPGSLLFTGTSYEGRSDGRFLFAGWAALAARRPELAARLRLVNVGPTGDFVRARAREFGLDARVEDRGVQPHRRALALMRGATALLLALDPAPDAPVLSTGKIFEYLRAGPPLLVIAPPGWARELATEYGRAVCAAPDDPPGIATALEAILEHRLPPPGPKADRVAADFDRRRLAGVLADTLETARGLGARAQPPRPSL